MQTLLPFTLDFWLGVGTAVVCGALIGVERQLRGKPAGIRTSILVCFGTQVFVDLGTHFGGAGTDPTRVLGQVVTGIGFLGGGVILAREGLVTGVTSATVIWVLAAIGATIGLHQYLAAIAYAIVTLLVLSGIEHLEAKLHHLRRGAHAAGGDEGHHRPNHRGSAT
jgi:putative Mg2+ transporter-C (MgtC) family protein